MEEITATYTQPFQNYPDVVSTLQLCEMLGVSECTVYRLLVTNQIKHFKVGRAYSISSHGSSPISSQVRPYGTPPEV